MSESKASPSPIINVTLADTLSHKAQNQINKLYAPSFINHILFTILHYIDEKIDRNDLVLPSFSHMFDDAESLAWKHKPKELDIYMTDKVEGKHLNLEARNKNYATNILSYPSDLPPFIIDEMTTLPLGELIICHEVVVKEASDQNKSVADHTTHILIHGILHLLGFDHELGQEEQVYMEGLEIAILQKLHIGDPYEAR